jgi:transcriptional regulator with XRE-family HTH domain
MDNPTPPSATEPGPKSEEPELVVPGSSSKLRVPVLGDATDRGAGPAIFLQAAHEMLAAFAPGRGAEGTWRQPAEECYLAEFVVSLGRALAAARGTLPDAPNQAAFALRVAGYLPSKDEKGEESIPTGDSISKVENGSSPPSIRRLGAIAVASQLPPSALIVAAEAGLRLREEKAREDLVWAIVARFREVLKRSLDEPLHSIFCAWKSENTTTRAAVAAFPASIGAAVGMFRRVAGLTQGELAETLRQELAGVPGFEKVSKSSHSQLECGACTASWPRLAGISRVLGRCDKEGPRLVSLSALVHFGERDAVNRQKPRAEQLRAVRKRVTSLQKTLPHMDAGQADLLQDVLRKLDQLEQTALSRSGAPTPERE